MAVIRENSEAWSVDPEKIFICGFSARGHLAASLGTLWKESFIGRALGCGNYEWKPDGMILCYPVISMEDYTMRRAGSACWENGPRNWRESFPCSGGVTRDTVPAFLWCTQEDEAVPMENSLLFAAALRSNGVPMELHIYEKGRHGLALCDLTTEREPSQVVEDNAGWIDLAVRWIRRR